MLSINEFEKYFNERKLSKEVIDKIKNNIDETHEYYPNINKENLQIRYYNAIYSILTDTSNESLDKNIPIIKEIDLSLDDLVKNLKYKKEIRNYFQDHIKENKD